ncbi:GGDEF domain-containing protein [Vibrio sp. 03-59-1]|uniref:GGDEF domain-containing protein n=1 Tax=Vibrio sp. 03-59-1 TaxID=2607607 RepID=UPI001493B470|nr:GGDEF domain-containing protein [Vibrio sp. 03-59-1]NOH85040.1 GGDEF domain-containing protein [Vibrio sp. 03-59-1]
MDKEAIYSVATSKPDSLLKEHVLTIACILLGIISTGLAYHNFTEFKHYYLGSGELIFATACFYIVIQRYRRQLLPWHYFLFLLMLTFVIIYGIATTKLFSGLMLWIFCLPLLYHLFLNKFAASLITFFIICITLFLIAGKDDSQNISSQLNLILPYIIVWFLSFSYEQAREKVQQKLEDIAQTDSLTEVKNRQGLKHDVESSLSMMNNLYILHFDIDHFKQVNDTYGHSAGDQVLKSTCRMVEKTISKPNLYRLGGEEFCIIYESKNSDSAKIIADSIRVNIENNVITIGEEQVSITVSAGLSPLNISEQPVESTLKNTDQALYYAKEHGRNQIKVY